VRLTPHPMARVHEGAGVGVALTVIVLDLYMWRLGALIGIFAPCCRSVCWEGDELEHDVKACGGGSTAATGAAMGTMTVSPS
jgi:hypothetical protein